MALCMSESEVTRCFEKPRVRNIWIIGDGKAPIETEVASLTRLPAVVSFDAAGPFDTFAALTALLTALEPIVSARCPRLFDDYRAVLERVCPALFPPQGPDPLLSADAVTFAIIRRISRESVHIAHIIDGAARFIRDAVRLYDGPVHLICRHADTLDRPSLRTLYRTFHLLDASDSVTFTFQFASDPRESFSRKDPLERRLTGARARLFRRIHADLAPTIVEEGAQFEGSSPPNPRRQAQRRGKILPAADRSLADREWLERLASSLVYQNYEQAYLTAARALRSGLSAEARAHVWRMVAIADANVGSIDDALTAATRAHALASTPTLKAHTDYLRGLLLTKRRYDLDAAAAAYARGLGHLHTSDPHRSDTRIERAWLLNGQALLTALRAKVQSAGERANLLERALDLEIEAFTLVDEATDTDAASLYLRYNLLANMVFVVEIMGRYDEAVEYWRRAFELRHGDAHGRSFEKVYYYRLGMLLRKAGRQAEAIEALGRARAAARADGDRFLEERITYGLAFTVLKAGDHAAAVDIFGEGAALARDLRDWDAFLQHACGALVASITLGHADEGRGWRAASRVVLASARTLGAFGQRLATQPGGNGLDAANLAALHSCMIEPSPKLPAYIAAIDLEATPAIDLNRHLAGSAGDDKDDKNVESTAAITRVRVGRGKGSRT